MKISVWSRAAAVILAAIGSLAFTGGGVAQAATPKCTAEHVYTYNASRHIEVHLPSYGFGGTVKCTLSSSADYNYAVEVMQYSFDHCDGIDVGGVDGYYGSKTVKGVKAFQKAKGLTQDGIFGPLTAKKMTWALNYDATSGRPGDSAGCGYETDPY